MKALRILLIVLPFVVLSVFLINKQNADIPKFDDYVYIPPTVHVTDINTVDLLVYTNQERAKHNIRPLKENAGLVKSANDKCKDLLEKNYWSHNDPSGNEPWNFIEKYVHKPRSQGENLAFGFEDAQAAVIGWMKSDAHRPNMLDTYYTDVGFAVCKSTIKWLNGVNILIVQHFAQI